MLTPVWQSLSLNNEWTIVIPQCVVFTNFFPFCKATSRFYTRRDVALHLKTTLLFIKTKCWLHWVTSEGLQNNTSFYFWIHKSQINHLEKRGGIFKSNRPNFDITEKKKDCIVIVALNKPWRRAWRRLRLRTSPGLCQGFLIPSTLCSPLVLAMRLPKKNWPALQRQ